MYEKGGVDAVRIKNDPAFERTCEKSAGFGRAGEAGKLLRNSWHSLIMKAADNKMTSRLKHEMVKVIQADTTNTRGQPNVIDEETELLIGFEFNENGKLNRTFFAPFTTAIDGAAGTLYVVLAPR